MPPVSIFWSSCRKFLTSDTPYKIEKPKNINIVKNKDDMKNLITLFEISACKNSILLSFSFPLYKELLLSFKTVVNAKNAIKKQPRPIKNDMKLLEIINTREETTAKRKIILILTKLSFLPLRIKITQRHTTAKNKIKAVKTTSKIPDINKSLENSPLIL